MTSKKTHVPAVTVYQTGTLEYQKVVLRAPVPHLFYLLHLVAFNKAWTFNIHHDHTVKFL